MYLINTINNALSRVGAYLPRSLATFIIGFTEHTTIIFIPVYFNFLLEENRQVLTGFEHTFDYKWFTNTYVCTFGAEVIKFDRDEIKTYIESNPTHWVTSHSGTGIYFCYKINLLVLLISVYILILKITHYIGRTHHGLSRLKSRRTLCLPTHQWQTKQMVWWS